MLELKYYEINISLGDLFDISKEKYRTISIDKMSLSTRQYNALRRAGCNTIEELLNYSIEDLYAINNMGKNSVEGIVELLERFEIERDGRSSVEKNSLSCSMREYAQVILEGKFDEIRDENINEEEIEKYRHAFEETEYDLLKKCVDFPNDIVPYIVFLDRESRNLKRSSEVIHRIPKYRLNNKAKGYIDAYKNVNCNWSYAIPDGFNDEESLIFFIRKTVQTNWDQLFCLFEWCSKDLKVITNKLIVDISKNDRDLRVVELRKEKKTLEEVGRYFGVTRERIRQIESKTRRKVSLWARKNKIFRMISADLNGKNIISSKDFESLLGEYGELVFFLLTDSDEASLEGFVFDKTYKVFTFGDNLDFVLEEEYVDNLSSVYTKNDFEQIVEKALASKENISKEKLKLVLDNEYQFINGIYKSIHEKLSLNLIYGEVLKKHFTSGIRVHVDSEIELFKKYVFDDFGLDISEKSNRSIDSLISRIGILCDRGTVCPKKKEYIGIELKEKIKKYILEKNNPLIFLNSIYSIFEEELNEFGINNRYYLQGVLKEEFSKDFFITRDYISREPVTGTIYKSVVEFIKKQIYPVSKEAIFKEFPGLTEIMLNISTSNDSGIINYFGNYIHIDRLRLFDFDKEYLNETMNKLLSDNKAHHDEEIYDYINKDNPDLLNRIYVSFPYRMYSFLEKFFEDEYQFARPYIAKNEVEIGNPYEQIKEYVIGEDCLDIDDILGFAKELHFQINSILDFLKSFKETHILINNEQIAALDYIGIEGLNIELLEKEILSEISETKPIRDLNCIYKISNIRVPWTDWLIYSIVDKYCKLLDVGASNNQFRCAVPLISPKGCMEIERYSEIKTDVSGSFRTVDDLNKIDDLIADMLDDEIVGWEDEL